jgi:hypothetical protein
MPLLKFDAMIVAAVILSIFFRSGGSFSRVSAIMSSALVSFRKLLVILWVLIKRVLISSIMQRTDRLQEAVLLPLHYLCQETWFQGILDRKVTNVRYPQP